MKRSSPEIHFSPPKKNLNAGIRPLGAGKSQCFRWPSDAKDALTAGNFDAQKNGFEISKKCDSSQLLFYQIFAFIRCVESLKFDKIRATIESFRSRRMRQPVLQLAFEFLFWPGEGRATNPDAPLMQPQKLIKRNGSFRWQDFRYLEINLGRILTQSVRNENNCRPGSLLKICRSEVSLLNTIYVDDVYVCVYACVCVSLYYSGFFPNSVS